jgi:hypothetical protein
MLYQNYDNSDREGGHHFVEIDGVDQWQRGMLRHGAKVILRL